MDAVEFATTFRNRNKKPSFTKVPHPRMIKVLFIFRLSHVHGSLLNTAIFAKVFKLDFFSREQRLKDVRMLELCSYSSPFIVFTSDVNGVVDEAELVVGDFVLKIVTVKRPELYHEINNFSIGVRDFDRVGFDMSNSMTILLQFVLQVDHEQSSALSSNIVYITNIAERVVKLGRCEPVYDVNCNLEGIGKRICMIVVV